MLSDLFKTGVAQKKYIPEAYSVGRAARGAADTPRDSVVNVLGLFSLSSRSA